MIPSLKPVTFRHGSATFEYCHRLKLFGAATHIGVGQIPHIYCVNDDDQLFYPAERRVGPDQQDTLV